MSVRDVIQAAAGVGGGEAEQDPYFANTTLLLQGNVSNPDLSYNAFSDASGNGVNITPYGDTRGSSFSPYNTSWSVYFPNNSDELRLDSNSNNALGTGVFTVEAWVWLESTTAEGILAQRGGTTNRWIFWVEGGKLNFKHNDIDFYSSSTIPTREWVHLAYVREGTGTNQAKLYINGQLDATGTTNVNFTQTNDLVIGDGRVDGGAILNGYISNVRLTKAVVYPGAFTPSTSPLTVGNDTYLLACHTNRFINGVTGESLLVTNSPEVKAFAPFLDTDTTTGSGYFDGSTSTYVKGNKSNTTIGTSDFTFEAWVYPTVTADTIFFGQTDNSAGGRNGIALGRKSNGNLWFLQGAGSGWSLEISNSPNSAIPLHSWTHIAASRSSGTTRYYVNGNLVYTYNTQVNLTSDNNGDHYIGALGTPSSNAPFTGYVSYTRLVIGQSDYDQAFTPPSSPASTNANTRLLACTTRGAVRNIGFRDESEYNHLITKVGNCAQGTFSPFSAPTGWSLYINNTRTTWPAAAWSGLSGSSFTAEYWYKPFANGGQYGGMIFGINKSGRTDSVFMFHSSTGTVGIGTAGSSIWTSFGTTEALPLNTWTHVAITIDGSSGSATGKIYLNGKLVKTQLNMNTSIPDLGVGSMTGTRGDGSQYALYGNLHSLRIVKNQVLYTGDFTPPLGPLTADSVGTSGSNVATSITGTVHFLSYRDSTIINLGTSGASTSNASVLQKNYPLPIPEEYSPTVHGGSGYVGSDGLSHLKAPWSVMPTAKESFTIDFWLYQTSPQSSQGILGYRPTATNNWQIYNGYPNAGFYLLFDDTTLQVGVNRTPKVGEWVHYAWTRSGSTFKAFINGELVDTKTNDLDVTKSSFTDAYIFWHGINASTAGDRSTKNTFLSFLRIQKGVAIDFSSSGVPTSPPTPDTNTTLLLNFTNAGVIDATGKNVIETVGSARTDASVVKFGNGSFQTNQNGNGCLQMPQREHLALYGDWTIEFWYKGTTTSGDPSLFRRMFDQGGGNSAAALQIIINTAGSQYSGNLGAPIIWDGGSGGSGYIPDTGTGTTPGVSDGNWHYVAVVREGTSIRTYVDGSLGTTRTISASAKWDKTSQTSPFTIGASSTNTSEGRAIANFDDFRITNGIARYTGSTHDVPTKSLPNQ